MTILTGLALVLGAGCNDDECPAGQVLYEGSCIDVIGQDPECGPGTYNLNGICLPHEDVCGANTEVVWVEDASGIPTGEFFCEGQSVTNVPPCPDSPDGAVICVSGWAKYLMDPANPCAIMETPILFGPDATQLEVAVFDPLAYAVNPATAPLGVVEVDPVTGTWKVEDIPVPATGFIAVVVRSIDPLTEFIFTGYPYPAAPGINIEEISAFGVTEDQNVAWSDAIGDAAISAANNCSSGDTLFDCGTWVGVFGYEQENGAITLLEGVEPRNGVGTPHPLIPTTNAFFLNDTCDGFVQPTGAADTYTGSKGVVFNPGAQLSNYMGTCADLDPDSVCETEGYEFESRLGGAAPQAIFVQLEYPVGLE